MFRRYMVLLLAVCGWVAIFASSAAADSPAPGWELFGTVAPTNLSPGGKGTIKIDIYNVGGAESVSTSTLTDTLPVGLRARSGEAAGFDVEVSCAGSKVVTCSLTPIPGAGPVGAEFSRPKEIEFPVEVEEGASNEPGLVNSIEISGGGALGVARTSLPVTYSTQPAGLGFSGFDAWFTNADGTSDTQAGSHPYELTVTEAVNVTSLLKGEETPAGGESRNFSVNLPPGLVGDPQAVPQCPRAQFESSESRQCPASSEVGEASFRVCD